MALGCLCMVLLLIMMLVVELLVFIGVYVYGKLISSNMLFIVVHYQELVYSAPN